jgi:hypothetical protein
MYGITDIAASPAVAVPIAAGVTGANLIAMLPIFINVATALYISMLIGHKAWVWYREWKGKQQLKDEDSLP